MKKSTRLKDRLEKSNEPLLVPGAFNAMSAKILEEVGFETVYMTGYGTSLNMIGMPDASLITMTEMALNAKQINNSISVPLIADCDTGFGNAINVRRSIAEFIQAGVAGAHIEDQIMPKRCGHVAGKQLIDMEEASGKIKAAYDTKKELDPDFLLIARTDARGAHQGGLEEAINRGNAYAEAGADMIFVEGPVSEQEIETICKEIHAPIFYNSTGVSPKLPVETLGQLGVSIVIIPGALMRASAKAMYDLANTIKNDGGILAEAKWHDDFAKNHPLGEFHAFAGFPGLRKLEEKYLPEEEQNKYGDSLGFKP